MDVALVELEETREGLHAALLFVELYAAGFVVGDLGEGSQHVENQVLVGREVLNYPSPGLKAVAVQEDAVGFLLDCEVAETSGQLDENGSTCAGEVFVSPNAEIAVEETQVLFLQDLLSEPSVGTQVFYY